MHYAVIKDCDIANGEGVRVSLFVSGCTNHCEQCFQPETWDFEYGDLFTEATQAEIMTLLDRPFIQGLTLLGGEPFEPANQQALLPFVEAVRARFVGKKDIWAFSGFTLEELQNPQAYPCVQETPALLSLIDVLVDGRFVIAEKDISLRFRGSRNQRVLNLPETLKTGTPVLYLS